MNGLPRWLRSALPKDRARLIAYSVGLAVSYAVAIRLALLWGALCVAALAAVRVQELRRKENRPVLVTDPNMPSGLFFEGPAEAPFIIHDGRHRVLAPCPRCSSPQPTHAIMSVRQFQRFKGELWFWCEQCGASHSPAVEELTLSEARQATRSCARSGE